MVDFIEIRVPEPNSYSKKKNRKYFPFARLQAVLENYVPKRT